MLTVLSLAVVGLGAFPEPSIASVCYTAGVIAAGALLRGQVPTPARVAAAAEAVRTCTESFDDVRGSAAYRQHLGAALFERALALALARAAGAR